MRTTLTLDDDVAAQLEQLREVRREPFKSIVNDVLRAGLRHLDSTQAPTAGPFTRPVSLGRPRLADVDDVSEALAAAEGEDYR
jgi:hypothetical protein